MDTPSVPPLKGEAVGISVHTLSTDDAQLVAKSGVHWIRIDISNNETNLNNSLLNAKNYNLSVLGILGSWMFNQSCGFTIGEWSSAVASNVSKYAPYVDAWEIWNEPTSSNPSWQAGVDYLSMVQIASPIIRQYDSTAIIVLLGGLQLYTGGNVDALTGDKVFARNLSYRNLTSYGDAISVHAYPYSGKVSQSIWDNYHASLAEYRQIFDNPSLDIWVTETGQNISDCDQTLQAQYLNQALNFFHDKVSHVFWYALHDENATLPDFGLVDNNGTSRQSYNALEGMLT